MHLQSFQEHYVLYVPSNHFQLTDLTSEMKGLLRLRAAHYTSFI